jgi:hypothetical protein
VGERYELVLSASPLDMCEVVDRSDGARQSREHADEARPDPAHVDREEGRHVNYGCNQ